MHRGTPRWFIRELCLQSVRYVKSIVSRPVLLRIAKFILVHDDMIEPPLVLCYLQLGILSAYSIDFFYTFQTENG